MKLSLAIQKRIVELANIHDISLYELAKRSGVPRSTISTLHRFESTKITTVYGVCEGLGITIKEFFDSPLFDRENIED